MKFLFSLLALIVLTESCSSTKETVISDSDQQKSSMAKQIPSGTFTIKKMEANENISEELTITFDKSSNKVSGFSGCNVFFGNYTIDGNTIRFGVIGSSKKYCAGDKNTSERKLFQILDKVDSFTIDGNTIILSEGTTLLLKAIQEKGNSKQKTIGGKK
ncbi:META domain-containing protein [Winogradskyella luteola]|uniref:META domain-containing protein n=1 Tax=Winogradskyella luteola TaxID=2828330 RepID=A0A9X1F957_9FLAO|nr:META domain-containing protein [Winogradskyella luteola]MBV7269674.1 META domain-containing protein [Winogradskyella luteola]